ncbi:MAG: phosphonate metabolism protein/1,5-bisphosphokinase (PRPP-forming) PhnN [Rhodospirillales bacterium]|nr:phosphonate metabolism protein/1,5-bisphosphokinase (PRPP-forming) PhnN [Rhodospirillales bacterium]MDE2197619.1 phosphonate metabolism protein/1,5-bisphosphokinase (PRPP-forming) PhnN [Rhodospirillales bacterium]MDE2574780.1 phosphonate metabolism protein/1,5-bisphosphokinase (PRPP-forming) PhnN [Rhodospirillales bacterium]
MLILVVGPSGAGKDTLLDGARRALAQDPRFRFVRRDITRPVEAGGEDHNAITPAGFAARRAAGAYALSWQAHGLGYGIPADIATDLAAGRVVIANGSRTILAEAAGRFPLRVLHITATPAILARRLAARGRESAADITERLARQVALPAGLDVATILNDGSVEQGVAQLLAELTRAAEPARPA